MRTPPTDDPNCIAWTWFFIILFFIDFAMMILGAVYFPKIKKPWFVKLWSNEFVRAVYVSLGIVGANLCYMFAGSYMYGLRILHIWLGIESAPWD